MKKKRFMATYSYHSLLLIYFICYHHCNILFVTSLLYFIVIIIIKHFIVIIYLNVNIHFIFWLHNLCTYCSLFRIIYYAYMHALGYFYSKIDYIYLHLEQQICIIHYNSPSCYRFIFLLVKEQPEILKALLAVIQYIRLFNFNFFNCTIIIYIYP